MQRPLCCGGASQPSGYRWGQGASSRLYLTPRSIRSSPSPFLFLPSMPAFLTAGLVSATVEPGLGFPHLKEDLYLFLGEFLRFIRSQIGVGSHTRTSVLLTGQSPASSAPVQLRARVLLRQTPPVPCAAFLPDTVNTFPGHWTQVPHGC